MLKLRGIGVGLMVPIGTSRHGTWARVSRTIIMATSTALPTKLALVIMMILALEQSLSCVEVTQLFKK